MNRALLFIPLGIFIAMGVLFWIGLGKEDKDVLPSPLIGKPFPEFATKALESGAEISATSLNGQPMLVNVWATWCPTCKAEHDELMRINALTDLRIVGVNYKDDPAKAMRWLADFGDPYEFVLEDLDGMLGVELGVYGAPESFLLDASGRIIYKRVGEINPRVWRDEIAPLLDLLEVRSEYAASD